MKHLLLSNDYFGHNFNIKFNGEGTYRTTYGGIISLFVKMLFAVYVCILASKLIY